MPQQRQQQTKIGRWIGGGEAWLDKIVRQPKTWIGGTLLASLSGMVGSAATLVQSGASWMTALHQTIMGYMDTLGVLVFNPVFYALSVVAALYILYRGGRDAVEAERTNATQAAECMERLAQSLSENMEKRLVVSDNLTRTLAIYFRYHTELERATKTAALIREEQERVQSILAEYVYEDVRDKGEHLAKYNSAIAHSDHRIIVDGFFLTDQEVEQVRSATPKPGNSPRNYENIFDAELKSKYAVWWAKIKAREDAVRIRIGECNRRLHTAIETLQGRI